MNFLCSYFYSKAFKYCGILAVRRAYRHPRQYFHPHKKRVLRELKIYTSEPVPLQAFQGVGAPLLPPPAIIFDWDNTLIENWAALTGAINHALRAFNLPEWDIAQMKANSRRSLRNSFPEIFGPEWKKARDIFYEHFRANHLTGLHALEGAAEILRLLDHHGIVAAVCSNKNGDLLRKEIQHLGWRPLLTSCVGANDAEKDKPDPAPVRLIFQANHLKPYTGIWFVGDTSADMICAARTGCIAIGVGNEANEDPLYPPKHEYDNLQALLTGLKHILSS
jgi:phosphoglycolate phosphatase